MILTKGKNIRRPKGEREDVLTAGARVFTLTSGNMNGAAMAQAFIDHLAGIETVTGSRTTPFVYAVGPSIFLQILPPPIPAPTPEEDS